MKLIGVRVGQVRLRESPQGEWVSAIEKLPVDGSVAVTCDGIVGDMQADRVHHGGPDKAVLAYCLEHYPAWRDELGRSNIGPGAMGENLDIAGLSEKEVCIGDVYRIADVLFQVSQPRQPCWKPAWLHGIADLTTRLSGSGRTGWYLRVLQNGTLTPGSIELEARPNPEWTIERANRLVYHKAEGRESKLALAALPELSQAWRTWLRGNQ